jgi:hypothetical protein
MYEFSIQPLFGEIDTLLVKEEEIKAAIVQADAAEERLATLKRRYESLPPDADLRLSEIIPETVDPIRFLIDKKAFLDKTGFAVKALSVSANAVSSTESNPDGYQSHTATFTLSGTYDVFRNFLRTLESSLVLSDPTNISFTTAPTVGTIVGGKPELATHDYIIQVTGYSLR